VLGVPRNLREPALNLDPLYGDGPFAPVTDTSVPYTGPGGIKLAVGAITTIGAGEKIPPVADLERDLPRVAGGITARIGDGRNDENLIVAQLHVAFLRFHNAVVDWVIANEPELTTPSQRFERARNLVRWHYQWLVVHDFLETVAMAGVAADVLGSATPLLTPRNGQVYMPLEFSVAAFRFGHSMVRAAYDHNRNFGRPLPTEDHASFDQLFEFTGNGVPRPMKGLPSLPSNWPIEWDRFVEKAPAGRVHRRARDPDRRRGGAAVAGRRRRPPVDRSRVASGPGVHRPPAGRAARRDAVRGAGGAARQPGPGAPGGAGAAAGDRRPRPRAHTGGSARRGEEVRGHR
jgi:hypothetical protein